MCMIYFLDVKNVTLRLPLSYVPARRVSYVCSLFSLPSDAEYHVIAALPYKDNSQILHGITVFGCGKYNYTKILAIEHMYGCILLIFSIQ